VAVSKNTSVAKRQARRALYKEAFKAKRAGLPLDSEYLLELEQNPDLLIASGGTVVSNNKNEPPNVLFQEDGYKHTYCPVCDSDDREVRSIMDDVLFCLDTNTLPNVGGALDQTSLFKIAYIVLKHERDIIKNERELKAIEKNKPKRSTNSNEQQKHRGGKRRK